MGGGAFLISFHNTVFFMKSKKITSKTSISHSESSFWNIWSYPSEIMSSLDTGCDNQVAHEVLLYYNYSVMPGFSTKLSQKFLSLNFLKCIQGFEALMSLDRVK